MLRQAREFKNFKLRARDGDIGKAREFYFDDKHWTVRYLVADTGWWLDGRKVLISPWALEPAIEAENVLPVDLTKKQIEESPSLASDQPVSQQFETRYYGYYGWPRYSYGPYAWGPSPFLVRDREAWKDTVRREQAWDPNLRSTQNVTGYHIQALDGEIGHVEDFIIDDETWAIRYLVVDTKNWRPGKHVLISPQWIEEVSWAESKVFLNLSRDIIQRSPAYTPASLNREYETELYRHYDKYEYWADVPVAKNVATGKNNNGTKRKTQIMNGGAKQTKKVLPGRSNPEPQKSDRSAYEENLQQGADTSNPRRADASKSADFTAVFAF